ncbi:MAG: aminotransferase class III-fold pyridoxal phosphate-dependent enzyme, partial [Treponema sp.]|nr:aminotransferase class III-fold pyridoxal phosphate-dependent enzyme [Treponema sp.]
AFGGRKQIMNALAPEGPVYQAGTLSGNPLAVAAGIAALTELSRKGAYAELSARSDYLAAGLAKAFASSGVPFYTNRVGSMWTTFFQKGPVTDYASAKKSDTKLYAKYFHDLLKRGVYIAPSQFEAGFVSLSHSKRDMDRTVAAVRSALSTL